ncbi:MAG: adenylosuccinate synthetase [Candidatus Eremiobacteraeota bacterium]|nr:adenylosuccinate synthetase [Candidatus Eremiobacteraeota bacterium]
MDAERRATDAERERRRFQGEQIRSEVPAKADVIVGLQWGDEGKGRIVDLYAADYDVVARFAGGDNAGHSIVVGERELALRIVPSGVMHPHVELFVGGGAVVNLQTLIGELDALIELGVDVSRVKISDRAHIVFPHHVERDKAGEASRASAIGTTGRGIGPAYVDRVARTGVRFADLLHRDNVAEVSNEQMMRIRRHIVDGVAYIHERLNNGKRVLLEGAQGSLLDVGYGTYPYVTSSHTIAGGACTGLGIGPGAIGRAIGVLKAYCTRVGGGPFPSELHDERGERLRGQGGEYGTVTGRPRRCGWLDAVAAQYAVALNGLTSAVITKLDVLTGFERVGIVTGYRLAGKRVEFADAGAPGLETEIEELSGWSEPIRGYRRIADLPRAARDYVDRVRELLGVPIELVSVGRERTQLAR